MNCCKEFNVSVVEVPPFSCGSTPINIQTAVWTKYAFMPAVPCADAAIVAGVGTWSYTKSGSCSGYVDIRSTICNPGTAYPITLTAPWDWDGNIVGGGDLSINFILDINGATADSVTRNLAIGPFTPIVLTGVLPATTISSLRFYVTSVPLGSPSFTAHNLAALTITPLLHP